MLRKEANLGVQVGWQDDPRSHAIKYSLQFISVSIIVI